MTNRDPLLYHLESLILVVLFVGSACFLVLTISAALARNLEATFMGGIITTILSVAYMIARRVFTSGNAPQ